MYNEKVLKILIHHEFVKYGLLQDNESDETRKIILQNIQGK